MYDTFIGGSRILDGGGARNDRMSINRRQRAHIPLKWWRIGGEAEVHALVALLDLPMDVFHNIMNIFICQVSLG